MATKLLDDTTVLLLCEKIQFLSLNHANEHDPKKAEVVLARQDAIVANLRSLSVLMVDVGAC